MLLLEKSKIDVRNIDKEIIISVTNNSLCLVLTFCKLFILELQTNNAPLFSLVNKTTFMHNPVIKIFCQRLQLFESLY